MIWWLYNLVFPVAYACLLPHFLLRMLRRGGYRRGFLQRFAVYGRDVVPLLAAPGRPIWIQAVSVGELAVAFSLMEELRRIDPAVRFVLTCNTSTGHALALRRIAPPDVTLYFPMDVPGVMTRAIDRIRPSAIVLVENEIWPNWIRIAEKRGIPAIMVNGRISAHSHKGYRKLRLFTRDLLPRIRWFCMQTADDCDRLVDLGAPDERMEITGSAKYDIAPTPADARARARAVLDRAGIGNDRRILVGGSTWEGEESALLDFYARSRAAHPDWFLVLVPRHAERREAILQTIAEHGLTVLQRSLFPDESPSPEAVPDVLLVDTTGELRSFYAVADVVFVGKSLTQTGGQNPIEPARDGCPVVVGPHMENFPSVAEDFRKADAWMQVDDVRGLENALGTLLSTPSECTRLGSAAAALVDRQAGATRRMAERIQALLHPSPNFSSAVCPELGYNHPRPRRLAMKNIHFLLGLFLYLVLVAAGLGLILAHHYSGPAQSLLAWMCHLATWQHVLMGVGLLVWLAAYFFTGLPRHRPQFIRFENDTGSINVNTDAVRKYIDGIRSDFAAVVWLKSAIQVRRGALEVGIVIGVKAGTQIPELCRLIQKRIGEVLAEHLGTCDLAGIGVEVDEIRSRNAATEP